MRGCSGEGKTTFAAELARRLGVPHLELDAVFHRPGWREATQDEFDSAVTAFVTSEAARTGWVVDGNYRARVGDLLAGADTVVWLDYPRRTVMSRVVRRTLGRLITRRELWNGNRESWRNLLRRRPEDNIVLWAWTAHPRYAAICADAMAAARSDPTAPLMVRLASPREARRWLDAARAQRPATGRTPPAAERAAEPPAR